MHAIETARYAIEAQHGSVDGYNIGINNGEAAGQTVFHLHVHVIPRRKGDSFDPRGGVRHVIPGKANYVRDAGPAAPYTSQELPRQTKSLVTGGADDPLLPHLKTHLAESNAVDIAVAFTLRSGLELLQAHLQDMLDRRGRLRILTGDYLGATDPDALLRLLDLQGNVQLRVFETSGNSHSDAFAGSFHPKAYLFSHLDGTAAAYIGSSNLSATALTSGVEWNYRVVDNSDGAGLSEVRRAYERLFVAPNTTALSSDWIENYRKRRPTQRMLGQPETPDDAPLAPMQPHSIQIEALAKLDATRKAGRHAGLVVLATGLGKTWLSAFDSESFKRVLFVAHREEILGQAQQTYRSIRPHDTLGRYTGQEKAPSADVLFASIQTLGRQAHLERFARDAFDYIVVDEFHHAEARTYRRLIEHFTPKFLLGLTATPERTDGADLLALCDDNLVYTCNLFAGIERQLLCAFSYFGVPDTVDYTNIPWRNRKFDEDELTEHVATQARAKNALEQYRKRGGSRTIAFCVSTRHADFMADFFRAEGITAAAVHSGSSSAPRAESLERLRDGSLAVICAVDMFNEGVDVPELDTILMLRPTESRIVWLQQFGRGLRRSSADKRLAVVDYIGNHRTFLLKPQALFGLPSGDHAVLNLLQEIDNGTAVLPPGCSVTYELEAKDILRSLLRREPAVETISRRYQDFLDSLGVRPTAVELFREGYNPRALRPQFGSWLGFVKSKSGLTTQEAAALEALQGFLDGLEVTAMVKSYKMLVLIAMLNRGAIPGAITLSDLGLEVAAIARRDPRIAQDIGDALESSESLQDLLRRNPIAAWVGGLGMNDIAYFAFEGNDFRFRPTVPTDLAKAAQELIREIAEWRLAEYLGRPGQASREEFVLKVSHSNGTPILFLPDRDTHDGIPEGWTDVLINDKPFAANVVKVAINVVRRHGSEENVLGSLLRNWFGDDAGKPGTRHQVMLVRAGDAWVMRAPGANAAGAIPFRRYKRADIAPLYGLPFQQMQWRQGFVRQGTHTFLFVTLDKKNHEAAFQYKDHFLSASEFEWQSQNRTSQLSRDGRSIQDHKAQRITVHLFVRAKAKTFDGKGESFVYCGEVEFAKWKGEKPITVWWKLTQPVPKALQSELGVPTNP